LSAIAIFISCGPDDDDTPTFMEEPRDEQQLKDKDSIIDYLNSHYYNSGFFATGSNHTIDDIVITELEDGEVVPDGNTLLINAVTTKTTTYLETQYEYYYLNINQGSGEAPNFTDKVRVRYEGSLVEDQEIFESVSTPIDLDLYGIGLGSGSITGWQRILPDFNTALDFTIGDDNIVNYNNYGFGIMFIPSGLAYYSIPRNGIPAYSNLIFKFELLQSEVNDHDNDGVPSYIEDYDNNLNPFDDDTDLDELPDYIDLDDDGDGVPTINEDIDGDGDPTNDIGVNGIPKYLDDTETESNVEDE